MSEGCCGLDLRGRELVHALSENMPIDYGIRYQSLGYRVMKPGLGSLLRPNLGCIPYIPDASTVLHRNTLAPIGDFWWIARPNLPTAGMAYPYSCCDTHFKFGTAEIMTRSITKRRINLTLVINMTCHPSGRISSTRSSYMQSEAEV